MNERTKELAEQAGYNTSPYCRFDREFDKFDIERFAELVRQDEREACAKVCDEHLLLGNKCAAAIRGRQA